jgi:hypothetical protein
MKWQTRLLILKWRLENWREEIAIWVAFHMPHCIVKWCVVRAVNHATDDGNPSDVTGVDVLKAWGGK